MARPPLTIGTYGKITRKKVDGTPTAFARFRDMDGRTRSVQRTGRTLAEAEHNIKAALVDRKVKADSLSILSLDSTINDLIAEWLQESRDADRYAPASLRTYKLRADYLISPGIGEVRIREATVPKLDRFVKLTLENHGTGSAATCRTILVNAFDMATRHGLTDSNLARSTAPVPRKAGTPEVIDVAKVKRLLDHLRQYDDPQTIKTRRIPYLYALNVLYVATGARTAELLALLWDDVDDNGTDMWINVAATLTIGEDNKLFRQPKTKSDSGMRRLKLPTYAANLMRGLRLNAYNSIVFPSAVGTHRWPHNMRDDWRTAIKDTEFVGITPTAFRKAVATVIRDEISIEAARDQLGHSSEEVTKKHYVKRLNDAPDSTAALDLFFAQ